MISLFLAWSCVAYNKCNAISYQKVKSTNYNYNFIGMYNSEIVLRATQFWWSSLEITLHGLVVKIHRMWHNVTQFRFLTATQQFLLTIAFYHFLSLLSFHHAQIKSKFFRFLNFSQESRKFQITNITEA